MGKKTSYTRAPPLACRDDLLGSLAHAWQMLQVGAKDRSAPFHLPTLATVDQDGQPHARTVVLRDCNVEERWLRFNTDLRSPKVSQIEANPRGALHFYDKFHKIQLRLKVRLEVLEGVALADVWDGVPHYSRECYQITKAPGSALESPQDVPVDSETTHEGHDHFTAVRANILSIDWLYLSSRQHRRALFDFSIEGLESRWIVP